MQSLIDTDEDFLSGKEIINAVSKFGFEINGIQMRASITRLTEANKAKDNGEQRAKKAYCATVNSNDITFDESDTSTSTATAKAAKKASSAGSGEDNDNDDGNNASNDNDNDTGDDVAGALDDKGTGGLTAKNAIVMALSVVPKGLGLGDLVKKVLATFPGKFSESTLRNGVTALAKTGDISKKKKGNVNIYLLKPQAA